MDLKGKCVLLGVSGGIAAYKKAHVAHVGGAHNLPPIKWPM